MNMSRQKDLLKNTVVIFFGKIFTQLLSFALIPLYTHYLTTGEYGIVDLIISYINLLAPVVSLQLEMAIFRFLIDNRDNEKQSQIIISNVILLITGVIGICIAFLVITYKFAHSQYSIVIVLYLIFYIICNIFLQIVRGLGLNGLYSISSIAYGVTNITLIVIFVVFLKKGINGVLYSMIFANFFMILFIFYKIKMYKYISFSKYDKKTVKALLNYSLPLIPNGISWWVMNVSDRTLIAYFLSINANGIYSVANKFSSIIVTIFNIFNLSWTENVSLHIHDSDSSEYFTNNLIIIIDLFVFMSLYLLVFIALFYVFIVGIKYIESYHYIPILVLASIFNVIVGLLSSIYIGLKLTKEVTKTSLFSAIINIVINICLIRIIGVYAAAFSTLISFLVMTVYRLYDLKKYIQIKIPFFYIFKFGMLFLIVSIAYYSKSIVLNVGSLILITILFILSYYKYIRIIINQVKKEGVKLKC